MGSGEARYYADQRERGLVIDHWSNGETDDGDKVIGGLGGWVEGETWRNYRRQMPQTWRPYLNVLRKYIMGTSCRYGGFWHQEEGCPVFSDGTVIAMSFRAWGDFMAAVWNTAEQCHHYNYVNFAWTDGDEYQHISWPKMRARVLERTANRKNHFLNRHKRYHHLKSEYPLKGKEGGFHRLRESRRKYGRIDMNLGRN